jgi:hypothetical protein
VNAFSLARRDFSAQAYYKQRQGSSASGRTVTVAELESGVWMIRTGQVIPDNELWLHSPEARKSLDKALEWSARGPRTQSDLKSLTRKVRELK